jgi:hypothetical protein
MSYQTMRILINGDQRVQLLRFNRRTFLKTTLRALGLSRSDRTPLDQKRADQEDPSDYGNDRTDKSEQTANDEVRLVACISNTDSQAGIRYSESATVSEHDTIKPCRTVPSLYNDQRTLTTEGEEQVDRLPNKHLSSIAAAAVPNGLMDVDGKRARATNSRSRLLYQQRCGLG